MRKTHLLNSYLILFILFISVGLFSCSSTQKIKYFQDIPDSGLVKQIPKAEYKDPIIHTGDILNVQVLTISPLSTSMVNAGNTASASSTTPASATASLSGLLGSSAGQAQGATGYLVDRDGIIEIPIIGKVKAAGGTTTQLRDTVEALAVKYYKDPVVSVRFANFKVSVTGEVLKPGQYVLSDEKVSVLDAIAMAGDLTIFGKRENVLLLRENSDGSKSAYRLNLKKSDIMSSSVFYLKQNDIIYVEPRKAKSDATDAAQTKYVAIAGSILSLLLVFATRRL